MATPDTAQSTGPSFALGERFPKTPEAMKALREAGLVAAGDLAGFLDRSPTPYHAASEVASRLKAAGFSELSERDTWALAAGDRRYVIRGGGTVIAFIVGSKSPSESGFCVIGAHTDSPNLRVKPSPDVASRGYRQVGVEIYGGVLLTTWFDRDLSLAGRVICAREGGTEARLIDFEKPIARIPSLAIHLNRGVNTEGFAPNPQKHMAPVVGLGTETRLSRLIAERLDEDPSAILGYDLCFYGAERAVIGGLDDELLFAARLDNLASCHAATAAIVAAADADADATRVIALYDHEECGSRSATGAAGSVLEDTLARIASATCPGDAQALARAIASSILISADMAHAVHPNYGEMHEPQHHPELNRGLVIKSNVNQSYATNAASAAYFQALCYAVGYEPQRFVVRTDLPCGSTIGPITAARLGIATVDVGAPMLSMHSCREMCGTLDVHLTIETFKQAFGARSATP